MRYLCLPGAYGSAKNFQVQLGPFCQELSSDGNTSFFFTQGEIECTPPPGFLDYFGPPPHYRFVDYDGVGKNDVLERIRDFPEGENVEDVMNELLPDGHVGVQLKVRNSINAIYRTIEEHGPFNGICAYSEGTVVAATFILEEQRRFEEEEIPRNIKAAVFFAGWPPIKLHGKDMLVLADTCEELIDIPTCHVVGAGDPYLKGAVALYNVCDENTAILFDHGKGHTLPRNAKTLKELAAVIRQMVPEDDETNERA
ncbi:hypothetical protein MMC17_001102 [Xylographa soralifera]|nr:hypothetical protein [Xylographa soralifera]